MERWKEDTWHKKHPFRYVTEFSEERPAFYYIKKKVKE